MFVPHKNDWFINYISIFFEDVRWFLSPSPVLGSTSGNQRRGGVKILTGQFWLHAAHRPYATLFSLYSMCAAWSYNCSVKIFTRFEVHWTGNSVWYWVGVTAFKFIQFINFNEKRRFQPDIKPNYTSSQFLSGRSELGRSIKPGST